MCFLTKAERRILTKTKRLWLFPVLYATQLRVGETTAERTGHANVGYNLKFNGLPSTTRTVACAVSEGTTISDGPDSDTELRYHISGFYL